MNKDEIKEFYFNQLRDWELAHENCSALIHVLKKPWKLASLKGYIQFNKARAISTMANVDTSFIKTRKCFLCATNRPQEQRTIEIIPGWELLVNPFPILQYHFTIASKNHIPQKLMPEIGIQLAVSLPGMVVFYNDEGAGASAPDHAHFQAVPIEEMPLIKYLDEGGKKEDLPFLIKDTKNEIESLQVPLNAYFWQNEDNDIRFIAVPRKLHRPQEFYMHPPKRRAVSPGGIDMAGVLVTPIREDFDAMSNNDVERIFQQVAFCK